MCPKSPWWYHRAFTEGSRVKIQLRQANLSEVLRPPPSSCHQLPQAWMRSLVSAPPVRISLSPILVMLIMLITAAVTVRRSSNSGVRLLLRHSRHVDGVRRGSGERPRYMYYAHMQHMICIHAGHESVRPSLYYRLEPKLFNTCIQVLRNIWDGWSGFAPLLERVLRQGAVICLYICFVSGRIRFRSELECLKLQYDLRSQMPFRRRTRLTWHTR